MLIVVPIDTYECARWSIPDTHCKDTTICLYIKATRYAETLEYIVCLMIRLEISAFRKSEFELSRLEIRVKWRNTMQLKSNGEV